jgi:hypothetical protein
MAGYREHRQAFAADYLQKLQAEIRHSRYFTVNNLNRDFVGTRGFSVVFQRATLGRVQREMEWASPYLDLALRRDCNAFYLNPLQLDRGSYVAPHIDRSLHAYLIEVDPPVAVTVLYVDVPAPLQGGRLVLRRGKKFLGRITPEPGLLVEFDGDLQHEVERVDSQGPRLSLVCEQYCLLDEELKKVPEYRVESRARSYGRN